MRIFQFVSRILGFFLLLFLLSSGSCSKSNNPIEPSVSINRDSLEPPRIIQNQPQDGAYFERTAPEELLNPNITIPWTVNNHPVFTAVFHSEEKITFRKIYAGVDETADVEIIQDGYNFSIIPKYELKPGCHKVYLGVVFNENIKPYGKMAWWRFEVLEKPPQIIGVLEDEKTKKFFLCFSREIDKIHASQKENWTLNKDGNLIKEVFPWEAGNWMILTVTEDVKENFNGETDYWVNYNTGQGDSEYLLIPKDEKMSPGGGPDSWKCAEVIYNDAEDKHYSKEGEDHAVTFEVRKYTPDCNLNVVWSMNRLIGYLHHSSCNAPLSQERDDYDEIIYSYPPGFFSTSSGRNTYTFSYKADTNIRITYKHGNEIIWGPQTWAFPPDLQTPVFTLSPIIMNGLSAADFLERHYWEKLGEPPGQLPPYISEMLDHIRTFFPCTIFCLWGAEDVHTLWHTLIVDYGTDENQIPCPDHEITINEGDLLNAFFIDLPRKYDQEYCAWKDSDGRLYEDGNPEGEYKVWLFEIENFIRDNPDMTVIKPVVVDMAGNWKRGPNIRPLVQECNCADLTVNFAMPRPGDVKQYINLSEDMNLPANDWVPYERRGRYLEVVVTIRKAQAGTFNKIIKPGTKLVLSWEDPAIDNQPFTTNNNPSLGIRNQFPWTFDDRIPCVPNPNYPPGTDCNPVVPWDNHPTWRFPNPSLQGPSPPYAPNYPHSDNSFPGIYPAGFENMDQAYSRNLGYEKPGYGTFRDWRHELDISTEIYFSPDCNLIVMTDFWTSNFGGDNYTLTAHIEIPGLAPCSEVNHNGIINVWRKAYLEESVMENGSGIFWGSWGSLPYLHYNGPFVSHGELQYIKNAFDDCFIEVREGYGRELNTQYQRIINNLPDYAHDNTFFDERATPVAAQLLYVDHLMHVPFQENILGITPGQISERHHTGNAFGSIYDIYGNNLDSMRIDRALTDNEYFISNTTAAHELGHSLGFHSSDVKNNGHRSGPGIMWSYEALRRIDEKAMSYIWGDHVFVLRLSPAVIDN